MARKLSEYKGEDALLLLADLLEPALIIMKDGDFVKEARAGNEARAIKVGIKNHPHEVMEILAIYNETPLEEFKEKCNFASLPKMAIEIMEDKDLIDFFTSQRQTVDETASSSALENTAEAETSEIS